MKENDLKDIIKEIDIMKNCENDYIVAYYDNFFKKDEIWVRAKCACRIRIRSLAWVVC